MNCDLCDRKNAESVGIYCGTHKACVKCINELVNKQMEAKICSTIQSEYSATLMLKRETKDDS